MIACVNGSSVPVLIKNLLVIFVIPLICGERAVHAGNGLCERVFRHCHSVDKELASHLRHALICGERAVHAGNGLSERVFRHSVDQELASHLRHPLICSERAVHAGNGLSERVFRHSVDKEIASQDHRMIQSCHPPHLWRKSRRHRQ